MIDTNHWHRFWKTGTRSAEECPWIRTFLQIYGTDTRPANRMPMNQHLSADSWPWIYLSLTTPYSRIHCSLLLGRAWHQHIKINCFANSCSNIGLLALSSDVCVKRCVLSTCLAWWKACKPPAVNQSFCLPVFAIADSKMQMSFEALNLWMSFADMLPK